MVEQVPVRHSVGGSIPSLFAIVMLAAACGAAETPSTTEDGNIGDASVDAPDTSPGDAGKDGDQLGICQTSTEACEGLTGPVFYGKAYGAACSGEWIRERCTLRGGKTADVYCCPWW